MVRNEARPRSGFGTLLAKVMLLLMAAIWHGWVSSPSVTFGILFGVLPYWLLVMSWERFRLKWIAAATLLALCGISWSAGSEVLQSTSAMAGVALIMASFAGCAAVGLAWLIQFFVSRL